MHEADGEPRLQRALLSHGDFLGVGISSACVSRGKKTSVPSVLITCYQQLWRRRYPSGDSKKETKHANLKDLIHRTRNKQNGHHNQHSRPTTAYINKLIEVVRSFLQCSQHRLCDEACFLSSLEGNQQWSFERRHELPVQYFGRRNPGTVNSPTLYLPSKSEDRPLHDSPLHVQQSGTAFPVVLLPIRQFHRNPCLRVLLVLDELLEVREVTVPAQLERSLASLANSGQPFLLRFKLRLAMSNTTIRCVIR